MIAPGNLENGVTKIVGYVKDQAQSIRDAECEVFLGAIDNRTSVTGILRNFSRLKRQVIQMNPDVVHAQYGSVTAEVGRWIKGSRPLVVSFCGDDLLGTPSPGVYWRTRERGARVIGLWAATRADAIIVKSHNLLKSLPSRLRYKAIILPNGVNTDFFIPMTQSEARAQLQWSPRSKVVLFNLSVGQDVKNPSLARMTVDILARSVPDVSLQMLSNASREEVRMMMNASDCLLVTSLNEGSPNIVKEAMACNLPVVSVPCGDVSERLRGAHPGGMCPYEPNALAERIQKVFQLGCRSNGREQLIAQGLTSEKVAQRLLEIYHHLYLRGDKKVRVLAKTRRERTPQS